MYPIIVTVKYYDNDNDETKITNLLTYGESLAAAAKYIEEEYCDHIESITATYVGYDGQLFEVPNYIADILIKGGANYNDGLSMIVDKITKNVESNK